MRTRSTGESSRRYGPCEVCGQHAGEVFMLRLSAADYYFGHEECLRGDHANIREKAKSFAVVHHGRREDMP